LSLELDEEDEELELLDELDELEELEPDTVLEESELDEPEDEEL